MQLITPIGGDPVVREMILRLEIQRRHRDSQSRAEAIELPSERGSGAISDVPLDEATLPVRPETSEIDNDGLVEATQAEPIDWWAQARAVIGDLETLQLEERGIPLEPERWVSIMQGPMPTTDATAIRTERDNAGSMYRNVYGDLTVRISQKCTLRFQSRPVDLSNFAKYIPPDIACSAAPVMDLSGLDEYVGSKGTQ